jgi:hypothetical protein
LSPRGALHGTMTIRPFTRSRFRPLNSRTNTVNDFATAGAQDRDSGAGQPLPLGVIVLVTLRRLG